MERAEWRERTFSESTTWYEGLLCLASLRTVKCGVSLPIEISHNWGKQRGHTKGYYGNDRSWGSSQRGGPPRPYPYMDKIVWIDQVNMKAVTEAGRSFFKPA